MLGVSDEGSVIPMAVVLLINWDGTLPVISIVSTIGISIGSSDLLGTFIRPLICVTIKLWFGSQAGMHLVI